MGYCILGLDILVLMYIYNHTLILCIMESLHQLSARRIGSGDLYVKSDSLRVHLGSEAEQSIPPSFLCFLICFDMKCIKGDGTAYRQTSSVGASNSERGHLPVTRVCIFPIPQQS